jgi:hypothetical protein
MIEVRTDGITNVSIESREELVITAVGLAKTLEAIPELKHLVAAILTKKITLEELGIESIDTVKLDDKESFESALAKWESEQPAKDEDIPDFVKRSMKGKGKDE